MVPQKSLTFYFQGVWRGEHLHEHSRTAYLPKISQCFGGVSGMFFFFKVMHHLKSKSWMQKAISLCTLVFQIPCE